MEMKKHSLGSALKKLYDRRCDISRYEFEINENGISVPKLSTVYKDVECRISYSKGGANEESITVSKINRAVKIFLPIEYKIESGDVFAVTKGDETELYKAAEKSRIYTSHQETEAVLYEKNP